MPAGPARAAAHLLPGEGTRSRSQGEHLARAAADSAADPGLRAQMLARRAIVLALGRVRRIAEAEQMAGQAVAVAGLAGPTAGRRVLVAGLGADRAAAASRTSRHRPGDCRRAH